MLKVNRRVFFSNAGLSDWFYIKIESMSLNKPLYGFGVCVLAVFMLPCFFCGCINNKIVVSSTSSPAIDFKKYKKYTFIDYFIAKEPGQKFHMYNDFANKDYTLEIVERKLETMGFTRDDKDPDFAIWVGFSIEYVDLSDKNKPNSMEMIPTGKNYLIFTPGTPADDFFKYHVKMLGIAFLYVEDIPRYADIKKLCALSDIIAKARVFDRELTREELIKILKETVKLSTPNEIFELDIESLRKSFDEKYPCTPKRLVWSGFVGYFSKEPYLEEDKIPILIDVALDSYPFEHIPVVSKRHLRNTPDWFEE